MPSEPSQSVAFTTFPRHDDPGGTRHELSRDAVIRALATPLDADGLLHGRNVAKEGLPLYAFATFADNERSLASVELVYALGFDVDETPVPSAATLRERNVAGFFYPSSSSTPEAPRWRLFFWLDRPVTAPEYYRLWSFVSSCLGFPVGQAAKDPSRGWYVPREPAGGTFELHEIPGKPLEVDVLLPLAPAVSMPTREEDGEIGVTPIDITTDLGKQRVARAVAYLKDEAKPAISGEDGHRRAFGVAQRLMRGYELPIDVAADLWIELYNPRCAPPWSETEIDHKLTHARDRVSGPTGLPSDGFLETLGLPGDVRDVMRAPRRALTEVNKDRRRERRPEHVYTHTGNEQTRGDAVQVDVNQLVHTFTSHEDWRGVWQYDEFKKALRAVEPPMKLDAETFGLTEEDVTFVGTWFRAKGMLATDQAVKAGIKAAAKLCRFHPVREYLQALPETAQADARAWLEAFAVRALGVDAPHVRVWVTRWLVAAVRRILVPGTKVDTMLVLYGGQSAHKSKFCGALFGDKWFRRQMPELNGRDGSHALEGFWGIEIGELAGVLKEETRTVKEFLSREVDHYRQFGNGEKVEFPRQCVFIGTTNEREFLRDPTGERRFWPIGLGDAWIIPAKWVESVRDKLWSAALALALLPTSEERPDLVAAGGTFDHWTTREDDAELAPAKEEFHQVDPWLEMLEAHCAGQKAVHNSGKLYLAVIAPGDEGAAAKMTQNTTARVSACMQRLGCKYQAVRLDGVVTKGWKVPDALADTKPSPTENARRARAANKGESERIAAKIASN